MKQKTTQWQVLETAEAVAIAACHEIMQSATQAIKKHGQFRIVLAGGSTPERVYRLMAQEGGDWNKWLFYLGDERCLPVADPERNSEMIRKNLLDHLPLSEQQIQFIPAEKGAEKAAEAYRKTIETALPFDLVILGMGEDGHTASLFPQHQHHHDEPAHAVHHAPKPPEDRVSLSQKSLSNTQHLLILVTGENKQQAVAQWQQGDTLPIATISSLISIKTLLDKAAFGKERAL